MTASKSSRCRKCKAPILWAVTTNARPMPIDPEPHPEGNVRLREHKGSYFATVLTKGELESEKEKGPLHQSHFATCEFADRFRKAKRGG